MATQKVVPFPEVNRERQEWARVQLVLRQGRSRRLRQWLAVLWFALVLASTWLACRLAGHSPASASEPMLVVFGLALWTFRRMEMGLTQPTLDDRAVMEFGEDFDALPEQDRIHIFDQLIRDSLAGRSWPDERQKEQRTRAESKAYRVLRPVLVALVALYWAVCLLGPFEPSRTTLAMTAIAFTWLVLLVLLLPTMIRLWVEPDEAGEVRMMGNDSRV
jgi:hypothetical protein